MTGSSLSSASKVLVWICVVLTAVPTAFAETAKKSQGWQVLPQDVPKRGSAEYYSTVPDQRVMIPVNIWGEVIQPGIHFLPVDSSVAGAVAAAGGPNGMANLPQIRLVRDGSERDVNLFNAAGQIPIKAGDTVYVERNFKSDLPLYFGAISAVVSVATLYFVTRAAKK